MKVGDLVQRKGTPEWKAIVTGFVDEHHVQIVWFDYLATMEQDACSVDILEVISESR